MCEVVGIFYSALLTCCRKLGIQHGQLDHIGAVPGQSRLRRLPLLDLDLPVPQQARPARRTARVRRATPEVGNTLGQGLSTAAAAQTWC